MLFLLGSRYCETDLLSQMAWDLLDFAAWFEAYLDGHWYTFGARNNIPRIGRVLIARGAATRRRRHQQYLRSQHPEQFQGSDRRGERGVKRLKARRALSARPWMYSASCLRRKRFSPASTCN
jgi:hypothetical protein